MQFNTAQCEVLSIRHQSTHNYRLGPQILQRTSHECDFGVLAQNDLGCLRQTERAPKKANQHFGLLRSAGSSTPQSFRKCLVHTLSKRGNRARYCTTQYDEER
ncbi:unnamed protein product [Dicrocoelium dendriticum]|nr:unnamed protein product [Dicrocoelium dendriticum]